MGIAAAGERLNEHIEEEGPTVFHHACKLGLEGIVSKHKNSRYRSGPSGLDQEQEPERAGGEAGSRRGLAALVLGDQGVHAGRSIMQKDGRTPTIEEAKARLADNCQSASDRDPHRPPKGTPSFYVSSD
jgi:hypothetical protein